MEFLFQLFAELLLQAVFGILLELGFHGLAEAVKGPRRPILAIFGFIIWGVIAGGISLLIFPESMISNSGLRIANLVVTPIMLGLLMAGIGMLRARAGQVVIRLDRFTYAFVFAFLMALTRFIFAA